MQKQLIKSSNIPLFAVHGFQVFVVCLKRNPALTIATGQQNKSFSKAHDAFFFNIGNLHS